MTTADGLAEAAPEDVVPVSFRLSTYWKLGKDRYGPTHVDSKRISLPEVLGLLWPHLSEEELAVSQDGAVTTIVIDWAKVPMEIRDPFAYGVRR